MMSQIQMFIQRMAGVGVVKAVLAITVAATACTRLCLGQGNCFPGENVSSRPIARSVESFGLSLFTQLASAKSQQSIFISPYSIWSALAIAYFGSEGNTKQQLEQVLNVDSKISTYYGYGALKLLLETDPSGPVGVRFKSSNRAYFSNQLVLDRCLATIINDGLQTVDFTRPGLARNLINAHINATTEGRIPELVESLPATTRFALINAVFFKGLWATAFKPEDTRRQEFMIPPGVSGGQVQMMTQEGTFKHGVSASLGADILELPYRNSSFCMFLLLPSNTWSTNSILKNLTPQTFSEAYSAMTQKKVDVALPKFKLETRIEKELMNLLAQMGVRDLFDGSRSNLSDFTRSERLFVDTVIHQANVEVTEEGTVATAATGLINTRFGGPDAVQFICNRPYVFLIADKINNITIFAGHVVNPAHLTRV
nr:ovalbumin-related protein X-like isoform X3 [Procambarus clarkii]